MKKFSVMLILVLLASILSVSANAVVAYEDRLVVEVPYTDAVPAIDGTKDACYTNSFDINKQGPATVDKDLTTGVISYVYNGNTLYGYLEVTGDTTPMEQNAYPYENDNFEQYFDLDCSMPEYLDENQYRYRIMPATDTLNTEDYDSVTSHELVIEKSITWNDTGYVIEFAYTLPVAITAGMEIGYDADLTDDRDGDGARNTQVFLGSNADDQWNGAANFGCIMKFTAPPVVEAAAAVETAAEAPTKEASQVVTEAPQTADTAFIFALLIIISGAGIAAVKSGRAR